MATLAPSLKSLFNQLDDVWPNRDRKTDGWYRNCTWVDHGTDHCPTASGMVHAIDIDKDGINPDFVVSKLIKMDLVVRYVIWNRHIWEHKNGWRQDDYHGTDNPHTDHIHVSIEHTYAAEHFTGSFGLTTGVGDAIGQIGGAVVVGMPVWDAWPYMENVSNRILETYDSVTGSNAALRSFRQQ